MASRRARGMNPERSMEDLEQRVQGLQKDMDAKMRTDLLDVQDVLPIIKKTFAKVVELQKFMWKHPYIATEVQPIQVFEEIIANCKTLVNQGARAELSELFHYISMAETALGKLRSGRKFNRLSLAFDKDYDEAINFRKEMDTITYRHGLRGLILLSSFAALSTVVGRIFVRKANV